MMLLIHILQPIQRQVRVDLRGRNIGMAEDRLHRAQVGAVFHHVGGATVAQHVRTGIASRTRGSRANHLPDALAGQLPRASSQE